jgi:hypothetical protein
MNIPILHDLNQLRRAKAALPYIAYVLVVATSGLVILFSSYFYEWIVVAAKLVGVGASTALFTRFLGGMGMFKDAISDVLGEDRWLDRRSDLPDLWRRITRRLFLPGYDEKQSGPDFLGAFNNAVTKSMLRPAGLSHGYYEKEATRTIELSWKDRDKEILQLRDQLSCTVIVFSGKPEAYSIKCSPTAGNAIEQYELGLSASLDGAPVVMKGSPEGGMLVYDIAIPNSNVGAKLQREINAVQIPSSDPTYYVICGHITWGMTIIVINEAPGLKVSWEQIGVEGSFKPESVRSKFIHLVTKDTLLPDQGVLLVLTVEGKPR